jgi:hypothetical protein
VEAGVGVTRHILNHLPEVTLRRMRVASVTGLQQFRGDIAALRDLVEIRLLRLNGQAHWRLRSAGGEALLIPVDAAGAEVLAHGFTALPGLDMGAVSQALAHVSEQPDATRLVWRRPDHGGLT